MRTRNSRPIRVSDVMFIVAWIALGLGLAIAQHRFVLSQSLRMRLAPNPFADPVPKALDTDPPDVPDATTLVPDPFDDPDSFDVAIDKKDRFANLFASGSTFLTVLTLGLFILSMRSPRRSFRSLGLQLRSIPPGITVFFLIFTILRFTCQYLFFHDFEAEETYIIIESFSFYLLNSVAASIALIWSGLIFTRRFRIRGWLDWTGVSLGIAWMSMSALDWAFTRI